MKKIIKQKLKAMTLVEVLIALAVFTIMSSLLASTVAIVCSISRKTTHLNKKIAEEAPAAEMMVETAPFKLDSLEIVISDSREIVTGNVVYEQYKVIGSDTGLMNFNYIRPVTTAGTTTTTIAVTTATTS